MFEINGGFFWALSCNTVGLRENGGFFGAMYYSTNFQLASASDARKIRERLILCFMVASISKNFDLSFPVFTGTPDLPFPFVSYLYLEKS